MISLLIEKENLASVSNIKRNYSSESRIKCTKPFKNLFALNVAKEYDSKQNISYQNNEIVKSFNTQIKVGFKSNKNSNIYPGRSFDGSICR